MIFDPLTDPLGHWPRLVPRQAVRPLLEERDQLREDLEIARRLNAGLARDLRRLRSDAGAGMERLDSDLLHLVRDLASGADRAARR